MGTTDGSTSTGEQHDLAIGSAGQDAGARESHRLALVLIGLALGLGTVSACSSSPPTSAAGNGTVTVTSTTLAPSTSRPAAVETEVTTPGTTAVASKPSTTQAPSPQTSTRGSARQPTLGLKWWGSEWSGQVGFGTVRPSEISNGGDPTGVVQRVTWTVWGGSTADGEGTAFYEAPNASVAESVATPAHIRAYDLTTCHGQLVYRHVTWWFPSKGQTYASVTADNDEHYDLCTGAVT